MSSNIVCLRSVARLVAAVAVLSIFGPTIGATDASAAAFKLRPNEKRLSYDRSSASFDLSARGVKRLDGWLEENGGTVDLARQMTLIACVPIPGLILKAACAASLGAAAPILRDRIKTSAKAGKCFGVAGGTVMKAWRIGGFGPASKAGCRQVWR